MVSSYSVADWYSTFCAMAGVDPTDLMPQQNGFSLPEVDSLNMWPLLSGEVTDSPRTQMMISENTFISGNYKLMTGYYKYAVHQAAVWPDSSTPTDDELADEQLDCVTNGPCLFNIFKDEGEREDIAASYPTVVSDLYGNKKKEMQNIYQPRQIGTFSCPVGFSITAEIESVLDDGTIAVHPKDLPCGCWYGIVCGVWCLC